jgi:hypothetical protein
MAASTTEKALAITFRTYLGIDETASTTEKALAITFRTYLGIDEMKWAPVVEGCGAD